MDTLAELSQTVQELETLDAERTTLMNRRDDLVLKALTEGARWSQIEHLPGLSRRSIQKIREKRGVARTTE